MSLLFILKKHTDSAGYSINKSGLLNSASLVVKSLKKNFNVDSNLELVVDSNEIDKFIVKHKATVVILEAIWCPPYKLIELNKLHPKVMFIVRVHSKIPFLANEGIAIRWIKEYNNTPNTFVTFNNKHTYNDMSGIMKAGYLPNIYSIGYEPPKSREIKEVINIGCFGAVRPMKNHLNQAIAAITYAEKKGLVLRFHINSTRLEQGGLPVLHNLQALFKDTKHELVEHPWMSHEEFKNILSTLDLGMQVSMSESFNIVCADFVSSGVPIIVSEDIDWMPWLLRTDFSDVEGIVSTLSLAKEFPKLSVLASQRRLHRYNENALKSWESVLKVLNIL